MKRRNLLFSLLTLFVLGVVSTALFMPNTETESQNKVIKKKKNQAAINGAIDFYHRQKANYQTGEIEVDKILAARKEAQNMLAAKTLGLTWEEMGPNNVGGRVRALLIDNTNPSIMYAGGVNGGLWKSTTAGQSWVAVPLDGSLAVSSICQTPAGDIYVGTGEGLAQPGNTNHNTGAFGAGIYYKSASGSTFSKIANTASWTKINRLASDMNGKVYAATNVGLKSTTDGGATWDNKVGSYNDVKTMSNDVIVIASSGNKVYVAKDGVNWTTSPLPASGTGRIELAMAPTNHAYMYAVLASSGGAFQGIYRSTDTASSWYQIAVGGSTSFNLFGSNNQGWYDNVAMVHGSNPDIVFVGGIDMWKGEKVSATGPFSWTKKTLWNASEHSSIYVHADQHAYIQHPTQPNTFYIGCDGGIFKTIDGGISFATLNKNFNVTQFYAVSSHPNGGAIGGTQDNGTQFVDLQGNSPQQARKVRGGDGGWAAASMLNQEVIFASIYYGDVARSADFGETFQETADPATGDPEFYSQDMLDNMGGGAFVTPTILWETINFPNSKDSVLYVADNDYVAGDTVDGRSLTNNAYPFAHELQQNLTKGDTIKLQDPIQSRLFVGTINGIYMTKQSLYFVNKTPIWYLISKNTDNNTTIWNMQISRDGDILYYTNGTKLYRLSNLLQAQDELTATFGAANYVIQDTLIKSFNGLVSSISIDPADANRVMVTLSGTGNDQVYYSTNATSQNPVFAVKKGNLPTNLPVYASLIPLNNSQTALVGTEYGIYTTDNINSAAPVWTKSNTGIDDMVTVYMLYQQQNTLAWRRTVTMDGNNPVVQIFPGVYNTGQVYAATHGRGFFTSKSYLSIEDRDNSKADLLSSIKLYPNPVENIVTFEYELHKSSTVELKVFDISGRLIRNYNLGTKNAGEQKEDLSLIDLPSGAYILQVLSNEKTRTKKFIKQ